MKTAEEILSDYAGVDHDEDGNRVYYEYRVIQVMKVYAKQVAQQALKDAAENAKVLRKYPHDDFLDVDKDSILETEIKLP